MVKSNMNKYNIKIVPQGGRTGLCGGTIPSNNGQEVMLSLERMNNIKEFNDHISKDTRVEKLIIPLGDGMTVCRKL